MGRNSGSSLIYATYLGGSDSEHNISGLAVDVAGNTYVSGETFSADFPTTAGAYDTTFNGSIGFSDVFIAKLNASGSSLILSTYLGGNDNDRGSIAIDALNNVYITGGTNSSDFPTTPGAYDITLNGLSDAYVSKLV